MALHCHQVSKIITNSTKETAQHFFENKKAPPDFMYYFMYSVYTIFFFSLLLRDSPYRTPISSAILQLQEGGLLHMLKNKWWKQRKGGGKCKVSAGHLYLSSIVLSRKYKSVDPNRTRPCF